MDLEKMAISVSDLNNYVKNKIAEDEYLNRVLVKGEISNFKRHYTGHLYFTLKDENSLIKCIMFKSNAQRIDFDPKDGTKVFVLGSVSVYERDGVYQIYVQAMKEDGLGALYRKYEELKKKLQLKGFFDENRKKKIPVLPKTIGVLTSQTGSVIKDIINVSTRRNPNVHIRIYPVPVQGDGAAEKIAEGIKFMNDNKLADVLILARGGGSLEDLWPFNEEIVAQAIYDSDLPVISAVGHETDFSISDFVADLRAPTPSAAAELSVPDIYEVQKHIGTCQDRLRMSLIKKVEIMKLRLEKSISSSAFKEPLRFVNDSYMKIDSYIKQMEMYISNKYKKCEASYIEKISKLETLSPLKTLKRGYSLVELDGKIIKSVKDIKENDKIEIKFIDGTREAKII